jgi:ABC-type lipoprotein export system ATPase subunit
VTDYACTRGYRKACEYQQQGRLQHVPLIFPNVEFRLSIHTEKVIGINLHLLFAPDDPNHLDEIDRFLSRLTFHYGRDYYCTERDLVELGRAVDHGVVTQEAALKLGATQFKLNFELLKKEWKNNPWVEKNCLIALSVSSNDGSAGLAPDAAYKAQREELERTANIIFSAQPKQREFWLGQGVVPLGELQRRYKGPKPCLHGCDAHDHDKVGQPTLDRRCWLKGDLMFETLRQVCLEPEHRTFIGADHPIAALPSKTMDSVTLKGAEDWFTESQVPLNPGFIAIIGARGSGKTALADLIACGALSVASQLTDKSFISRARKDVDLLKGCSIHIAWREGKSTSNSPDNIDMEDFDDSARAQYLSQQFVDRLCSAESGGDELKAEMERVVFNAHSAFDRMGASNFDEFLSLRADASRRNRVRFEERIGEIAVEIDAERARIDSKPRLVKQFNEAANAISRDKKERDSLVPKGQGERAAQMQALSAALSARRVELDKFQRRIRGLQSLRGEVLDWDQRKAATLLATLQRTFDDAALSIEQWQQFRLRFAGSALEIVDAELTASRRAARVLAGPAEGEPRFNPAEPVDRPLIPLQAVLTEQTVSLLEQESLRLKKLLGIDDTNATRHAVLCQRIDAAEASQLRLSKEIEGANNAPAQLQLLARNRRSAYESLFGAICEEEAELRALYAPLALRLNGQTGMLARLSFAVQRRVDVEGWVKRGEALLDLRLGGPFRGTGSLSAAIDARLTVPWRTGTAVAVAQAMTAFIDEYGEGIQKHSPHVPQEPEYLAWQADASRWLHDATHVTLTYGIEFDGAPLSQLSPGTRGIVLLLLYLALDVDDDRPLIIDQPEENLDPQSVFAELVPLFKEVKRRRQVIIVTHNANLVVNGDADQVIVASCGPHRLGHLPELRYESGGLENEMIRRRVCEILEGGKEAFQERARRLRVVI